MIKILIVDDSILFRSQIQLALKDCPEIEILGTSSNGKLALEKMTRENIDLCILDIEMPEMDGIETLKEMKLLSIKTKVIMFSSQSRLGADRTMEAIRLGAVDFVPKPLPDNTSLSPSDKIKEALLPKILSLFNKSSFSPEVSPVPTTTMLWETFRPEILVIASSTGGPTALADFFSVLKGSVPFPILVTQHMPPIFTASLAERLGQISGKVANEGVHGEVLKPNQIYVAPGNFHMQISGSKLTPTIEIHQKEQRNFVRPCADFLFESAATLFGRNCLGVVLTGMGRDGADGAKMIKDKKGAVLIQSESSCVVFGMPGAVQNEKNFDYRGTPVEIAQKILYIAKVKSQNDVA